MKLDRAEQRYEDEMGVHALFRQMEEGRLRYSCCGEAKASGHHRQCEHAEPDEPWQDEALFADAA